MPAGVRGHPWQRAAAWHRLGIDARESAWRQSNRRKGASNVSAERGCGRFTEPSKAYQALSVLKECDADGRIGLESAAIVERTADGSLTFRRARTTTSSSAWRAAR